MSFKVGQRPTSASCMNQASTERTSQQAPRLSLDPAQIYGSGGSAQPSSRRKVSSISVTSADFQVSPTTPLPLPITETIIIMTPQVRSAYNRVRLVHYLDVGLFGLGFLLCTITAYVFSKANYSASLECLLDAEWVLKKGMDPTQPNLVSLVDAESFPGEEKTCNFVQFGNVAAAIGGFILCWFFLLVKPYYDAYNQRMSTSAAKLVPFVFLVSLTFAIVSLIASIKLTIGFGQWCNNIVSANPSFLSRCSDMSEHRLGTKHIPIEGEKGINIYAMMVGAETCSWLAFVCWLLAFLVIVCRFAFHLDYPSFFFEYEVIPDSNPNRKSSSGLPLKKQSVLASDSAYQQNAQHKRTVSTCT